MFSAQAAKPYENALHGRPVRTIQPAELAKQYKMSAWHRVKTLCATLVEIVRESRELASSLRAKSGYSGFRED